MQLGIERVTIAAIERLDQLKGASLAVVRRAINMQHWRTPTCAQPFRFRGWTGTGLHLLHRPYWLEVVLLRQDVVERSGGEFLFQDAPTATFKQIGSFDRHRLAIG